MTELVLHKSLYDAGVVLALVPRYAGLAQVQVDDREHELVVRFDQVDADVADVLVDHFANHVLAETVKAGRRSAEILAGTPS